MAWDPKMDIFKEFARTPDKELLLWERWAKIRTEEVLGLGKITNQPPVDLAMNELEFLNEDRERKKALVDAKELERVVFKDSHYEEARRLKPRCGCGCENVYRLQKTMTEKQHFKVITHVQCAEYIQRHEKGVIGKSLRTPAHKCKADYYKYRQKREEEFKEPMLKIDPYRPDMRELVVVGRGPQTPPRPPPPVPLIAITEADGGGCEILSGVYALKVNNTIIIKEIPGQDLSYLEEMQKQPWHEGCRTWTYYFNVPEKRMGRGELTLLNLGTVTLRYSWKKITKMLPYIPEEIYEQKFFFCKNEDLICPGQTKIIRFSFVSEYAGTFKESFELKILNTNLFSIATEKLIVHLTGDSVENIRNISKKIERLQLRIKRKAVSKMVFDLIKAIIDKATAIEPEVYPYKKMLLEAELFLALNPVCFYHQTEVKKLNELYKEMTGKKWDLSLPAWRTAMKSQGFEDRMDYYRLLKSSYNNVLLKPWDEWPNVKEVKHRIVKVLLVQLMDKFYPEYFRVSKWNGATERPSSASGDYVVTCPLSRGPNTEAIVKHIFFIRMLNHMTDTIESCAAALSSLDLDRWIDFNFCQY